VVELRRRTSVSRSGEERESRSERRAKLRRVARAIAERVLARFVLLDEKVEGSEIVFIFVGRRSDGSCVGAAIACDLEDESCGEPIVEPLTEERCGALGL